MRGASCGREPGIGSSFSPSTTIWNNKYDQRRYLEQSKTILQRLLRAYFPPAENFMVNTEAWDEIQLIEHPRTWAIKLGTQYHEIMIISAPDGSIWRPPIRFRHLLLGTLMGGMNLILGPLGGGVPELGTRQHCRLYSLRLGYFI